MLTRFITVPRVPRAVNAEHLTCDKGSPRQEQGALDDLLYCGKPRDRMQAFQVLVALGLVTPGQHHSILHHHRFMRWILGGRSSDLEDRRGAPQGSVSAAAWASVAFFCWSS
jgi:hypothetical protein